MKILFVKPKAKLDTINRLAQLIQLEPLELGYLAAAVSSFGEPRVLDLRLVKTPDISFEKTLRDFHPDVVGLSGYTHECEIVKDLARKTKSLYPNTKVIVGGHHATSLPKDYDIAEIDGIVRGEGCGPIRQIVEALNKGQGLDNIKYVMLTGDKFDEEEAKDLPEYPDMTNIIIPRRDLWNSEDYRCIWPTEFHPAWQTIFPAVSVVRTSFGCKMDCSFCVVHRLSRQRHLKRDPEKIAKEIAGLKTDYVYFCDDETFLDYKHAEEVALTLKKHNIKKRYFAWSRATTVNRYPHLFKLWREIGLDAVYMGFEATTDEELKKISKHSTVAANEKALAIVRELGIAAQINFLVDPGFTHEDFDRLLNYVKNMPPAQVTFTVLTPSPGSPAWIEEKDRYVIGASELHDCMHPLSHTALSIEEFFKRFSELNRMGGKKNPIRRSKRPIPIIDIIKIQWFARAYVRALKNAYKDYPDRN